jgi:hypothetical protein
MRPAFQPGLNVLITFLLPKLYPGRKPLSYDERHIQSTDTQTELRRGEDMRAFKNGQTANPRVQQPCVHRYRENGALLTAGFKRTGHG